MGLFDKMFGHGAEAAKSEPNGQQRFEELKNKYHTVLEVPDQQGIQFQNLHVQDNKLYIKGTAPSEDAKNTFWDQIKLVDQNWGEDLTADIDVKEQQGGDGGGQQQQGETYTVQSGDTLSKIAKHFYGDPNEYMKIFYANRDKINDPNRINVGQELTIPPAE